MKIIDWPNAKITVCDACLRACCWQGEFMCDYSDMASTTERSVAQLRAGRHGENEQYWAKDAGVKQHITDGGWFSNSPFESQAALAPTPPLTAEEKK
jgi:hypothetical protein